jgi:hypothetical protein
VQQVEKRHFLVGIFLFKTNTDADKKFNSLTSNSDPQKDKISHLLVYLGKAPYAIQNPSECPETV